MLFTGIDNFHGMFLVCKTNDVTKCLLRGIVLVASKMALILFVLKYTNMYNWTLFMVSLSTILERGLYPSNTQNQSKNSIAIAFNLTLIAFVLKYAHSWWISLVVVRHAFTAREDVHPFITQNRYELSMIAFHERFVFC